MRSENEDAFYISPDGRLLIVADGMGGHEAGEVASALAVGTVVEFFSTERVRKIEAAEGPVEPIVLEAFEAAQQRVVRVSQTRKECRGMGTTLIFGYVRNNRLYTCHVGDVRGYVRNVGGLRQITKDHSVVGELVRAGQLDAEDARRHPRRNEILQAVGMATGVVPDINDLDLGHGDRVLLCSDGLWEALSDEEIRSVLDSEGSMRQRATLLVDRANAAGGRDNITVVLYEHVGRNIS